MGLVQDNDWKGPKKTSASVFLTPNLRLRLTDPAKIPVKNGKCRIADNPGKIYPCDADGIVEIPVSDWNERAIELEWEDREAETRAASERFPWSNTFDLDIRSAGDAYCGKRLTHLGFYGGSLSEQVMEYQNHFGLAASGDLKHIQEALVHWHDGGPIPGGGGMADKMLI